MGLHKAEEPYAFALVGRSGAGKTVLSEKLISSLTDQGYRVGSVKHHSRRGFSIDHEGKDSWHHREAGSRHVVVAAPDTIAHIQEVDHEWEYPDIIATMTDVDIVVVEGYRYAGLPTFMIFRADNSRTQGTQPDFSNPDIIGVITDDVSVAQQAAAAGLPSFGFEDVSRMCDYVLSRASA
jgi:molybdopterin-guanine dinucleotide biosynthesis protein MobB